MPEMMQNQVMELAHQALDAHEVFDCQSIAHYIKKGSNGNALLMKKSKNYKKEDSYKDLTIHQLIPQSVFPLYNCLPSNYKLNLMKHIELHGILWLGKTLDPALHIYVEVSYSSAWR
ncbi:hypothetical protein Lal_00041919 [Lupinus albus]|nr:hypothetical protein Lal_00041919 [Lupinus albus]